MMPIAWTRTVTSSSGKTNAILCTTMGDAVDLESEGLRRLIVNGVYQGLSLPVPAKADVTYVDPYQPGFYSGGGFRKGMRPKTSPSASPCPASPSPSLPVPNPDLACDGYCTTGLDRPQSPTRWFPALLRPKSGSHFPLRRNAAMRQCSMTTVVHISKRGTVTLPPALRRKFGFGAGDNPLILIEEREGEIVLRPASAVIVREIPAEIIQEWMAADEAGMREFESLGSPK